MFTGLATGIRMQQNADVPQETYAASPESWARIGLAVKKRRRELGLTIAEAVAGRRGIKTTVWSHVENGHPDNDRVSEAGLEALCRSLGWSLDSIARLDAGKEPLVLADDGLDPDPEVRLRNREAAGRETVAEIQAVLTASREIQGQLRELRGVVDSLLARVGSLEERAAP